MIRRTIMIFPQFDNIHIIDRMRERYDPLAHHVRPHITLVFPFESPLTSYQLKDHLEKVLAGVRPFRLTMDKIIKVDNSLGMYLFLMIHEGMYEIKHLSFHLYTGILEPYRPLWLNEKMYLPHMTIGEFTSRDDFERAYQEVGAMTERFTTMVDKVSVEIIDENEDSIIEMEVILNSV